MTSPFPLKPFKIALSALSLLMFVCISSYAQLTVSNVSSAAALTAKIAGTGITIVTDSLICDARASGTFVSVSTPIGLDSGILLTTGKAVDATGSEPALTSTILGSAGDADFNSLIGGTTVTGDACALIVYFVPQSDTISFRYQFGSEEYRQSTCGVYNDAFAFFLAGPGVSASFPGVNLAVVPSTNIPVAVNSVNSGTIGTTLGCNIANCTSMGAGSPFTSYFIDNTGGTSISYHGYTDVFVARHAVNPCDTYRIKMAIVDAGNDQYDSGVFIEAGSLSSHSFHFSRVDVVGSTISGIPNSIVRGCSPAIVRVISDIALPTPTVLSYTTTGTAIGGVDYTALTGTVTIPADSTYATFNVQALLAAVGGAKTLVLHLTPTSSCGTGDSIVINILDTPSAHILTPDTAVCLGSPVSIRVSGTAGLTYSWSPAGTLTSTTLMNPTATPATNTTYYMTASLPGSGCGVIKDSVTVSLITISISIPVPDTTVCSGASFVIHVTGNDSFTYSWSPATYLDSTNIKQPTATPTASTIYTVTASNSAGCSTFATEVVNVTDVSASIITGDTAICFGKPVQVICNGPATGTAATYQWIPTAGIAVSNVLNPLITPDTSAEYYLIGSVPGCTKILDSIHIEVEPIPNVFIGGNRFICLYDTLHINASVYPKWYGGYLYSWSPVTSLDFSNTPNVVFTAGITQKYILTVTTDSAHCIGQDSAQIIVQPGNFGTISGNTSLCPHDTTVLTATGGVAYQWYPSLYLSDSFSASPTVKPVASVQYTVVVTSAVGCHDTLQVNVNVNPAALISLDDSVILYPGETAQLSPLTNCNSFLWFPDAGLNSVNVSNPIASPDVDTRYFVKGITSEGCVAIDSINVVVKPDALIALPNAFTPGNGVNNVFSIIKRGVVSLNYFRVFNRWGNVVFETKDINQGWDGNYNGKPQSVDVYVYDIQAVTNSGTLFNKHGNVTLLR